MSIDFRNINTLWASIVVETLKRLGLTTAIICPGSRSTPLAVAFAQQPQIESIPILDERSASFFALGIAKKSGFPVALICTSGTAGANFYPAVIEAKQSHIPLLVITADRPPELRDCHSGQTIDQLKLYGNYPNWQTEISAPSAEMGLLRYLRQIIIQAVERSLFPLPGPVHLNFPFRDPLAPILQNNTDIVKSQLAAENFFDFITKISPTSPHNHTDIVNILEKWQSCQRGVIIAGLAEKQQPEEYVKAIAHLSDFLGWAVFAEALSPMRNYAQLNYNLIATYDLILRNSKQAENLAPEIVIQIGELPTSKELRTWLDTHQPQRWIVDSSSDNLDPLHGDTIHLRLSIEQLSRQLSPTKQPFSNYLQKWHEAESKVIENINITLQSIDYLLEAKVAWLLSQYLPSGTSIFIANSMPVRYMEFFWLPNNSKITPYFNRGANGIDGTLSTALGIAHRHQSSIMLTGDLALLHDTNGFLIREQLVGHLTIILINNNGGGIFEMLPIAQFEPAFEKFFGTPQNIDFAKLCTTYGVEHQLIKNWQELQNLLTIFPEQGIRVLEIPTDRKADAFWLQENLNLFATNF